MMYSKFWKETSSPFPVTLLETEFPGCGKSLPALSKAKTEENSGNWPRRPKKSGQEHHQQAYFQSTSHWNVDGEQCKQAQSIFGRTLHQNFFRKTSKRCKQQIQLQDLHDTRIDSGAASCHSNEFAKLYRTDLLPAGAPRQVKLPSITYPSKRIYGEVREIVGKSIRVSLELVQIQVFI